MDFLGGAHDDRAVNVALLDAAARNRLLDARPRSRRRPAVFRLEPPSTLMHCTRRAPELSATSRCGLHLDHGKYSPSAGCRRRSGRRPPRRPGLPKSWSWKSGGTPESAPRRRSERCWPRHAPMIFLRALDELLVERMHEAALDHDGDRLVGFVADHHPADTRRGILISPTRFAGSAAVDAGPS